MAGKTRHDRNEDIRQMSHRPNCRQALQITRYGHFLRTDDDTVCRIKFNLGVIDKRPKGRLKQRRLDTFQADLKLARIHPFM
ncbi:hypothetical protein Y032_1006g3370 [Ancylostoma ceylanicum]|uniref:Uncharacterized protein n=1 Tax=Ancylostoma ceylanicum TaxID=53326 RepID=A0A016W8N1_9BILA|nr:hypothetical protein Y032_1006g3370 [Ancylostoma ceylanicum]